MSHKPTTLVDATVELSVAVSRLTGSGQRELISEARQLATTIAHQRQLGVDNRKALLAAAEMFGAPFGLDDDQEFDTLPLPEESFMPSSLRKGHIRDALLWRTAPVRVGRYVLLDCLAAGGAGEIYVAYDDQLDRQVALKLMCHGSGLSARSNELLLREARALAQLSHPNIVHIYDVDRHDDRLFIVMELLHGQTLTSWLREASRLPRAQRQRGVLRQFIAAGRGLEAAHAAGVAHRDFKPNNVLVTKDGRVCLVDFGLAHNVGDILPPGLVGPANDCDPCTSEVHTHGWLTVTGRVSGTPRFMAPEQFRGEAADHRSDQFSFCVALFHALYGVFPFAGEHPQEWLAAIEAGVMCLEDTPGVAAPLREALRRGLSADPAKRFASMSELLAKLEHSLRPSARWIALTSSGAVAATAVLTILVGVVGKLTVSELMLSSLGLLTTLVGTAVGFYFGRITKPRD